MAAGVLVNGTDTSTIGWYVSAAPEWQQTAPRQIVMSDVLGRMGAVATGPLIRAAKSLSLIGSIDPAARTVAALDAAVEAVKQLCGTGLSTISWTNTAGQARETTSALLQSVEITPRLGKQHFQAASVADITASFAVLNPVLVETQPTCLALPSAARTDVRLGGAPSDYVLNVMGSATNPIVTYRNAGGDIVWQLSFTVTLATTDYLSLNSRTGQITKYASGTASDALAAGLLTSGNDSWPLPLDPHDGDPQLSEWPTLEVSAGTGEVLYSKAHP